MTQKIRVLYLSNQTFGGKTMTEDKTQADAENLESIFVLMDGADAIIENRRQMSDAETTSDGIDNQTKNKKGQIVINKPKSDQIKATENLTAVKTGQTKAKKNQTDNVKWSIFTEAETKNSAVKAAKKAGLKLNEWIDQTLRRVAIEELTHKPQPPAKPEDMVKEILDQYTDRMKADQAATVEAQNVILQQQGDQIAALAKAVEIQTQAAANQPATLKEYLFGKKKPASGGI